MSDFCLPWGRSVRKSCGAHLPKGPHSAQVIDGDIMERVRLLSAPTPRSRRPLVCASFCKTPIIPNIPKKPLKTAICTAGISLALASSLLAQTRTVPRSQGNYFELPIETVPNTMHVERLPEDWVSRQDRPLYYKAPFPSDLAGRKIIMSHGKPTHVHNQEVANELNLPNEHRAHFFDNLFTISPTALKVLPQGDPRIAPMASYAAEKGNLHDKEAARFIGAYAYDLGFYASMRKGLGIISFDLESGEGLDAHGAMYEGAVEKAAERGLEVMPFTYGSYAFASAISYAQNRDNNDSYFRLPSDAWRRGDTIDFKRQATAFMRKHGAYVGADQYLRATWDDASVWNKNPDGSIATDQEGKPQFVYGSRNITNYGNTAPLYKDEAREFSEECYSQAEFVLAQWRWYCNTPIDYNGDQSDVSKIPYPKGTGDVRPGLENLKLCSFFRNDTESIGPGWDEHLGKSAEHLFTPEYGRAAANARPCNPDAVESTFLLRSIALHGNMIWTDPYGAAVDFVWGAPRKPINNSADGGMVECPNRVAAGQFETMLKARYRSMAFQSYFDLANEGKIEFVIPKRFILMKNKAVGERETDKPILWGFKETGGRRFWLYWWWPAQDIGNAAYDRTVQMWVENGADGKTTGSYSYLCKDRKAGWEEITLPEGFEQTHAEDFRFQWEGLLGGTFTASGKYTVPVKDRPTPPAPAKGSKLAAK